MHPNLFHFPTWVPFMGGQAVTTFGLMMFLSFVTGGVILRKELTRKGYDGEKAWDMVFMAVVGGIIGAKLYYVLLNWDRLIADPKGMIFSRGGLVWYGGFILATVLVSWEVKRSKMRFGEAADATAAALPLAYAVGRIGCFLVGDDWGRPTDLPWGVRFPQGAPPTRVDVILRDFGITVDPALVQKYGDVVPVHPTQLYEVAISTLIFFVLWRMRKHNHQDGWLFAVWLACAGAERFFVEIFRAKDDRFFGPLTMAQMISLMLMAAGIALAMKLSKPAAPAMKSPKPKTA
jgi:phosphatidylglycerol:prolipoprotein diacylglycerol transferase